MAMPQDFWRNAQSLSIFRTKPCQRLATDGACGWKSQCQYSHCLDWPRRPTTKYAYSPMICPHVRMALLNADGSYQASSACPDGLRCRMAHSKEEVLFHPDIFKTTLCDEFEEQQKSAQGKAGKGRWCHRYYCPMAHGSQELQTSSLEPGFRQACLRAADLFPSDNCCQMCAPSWQMSAHMEYPAGASPFFMDGEDMAWPASAPDQFLASAAFWGMQSDTTDQPPFMGWSKDFVDADSTDSPELTYTMQSSDGSEPSYDLQQQQFGMLTESLPPWGGLDAPPGLEDLPAFIDISGDGKMKVGPTPPSKPAPQKLGSDVKLGVVYTML